MAVMYSRLGGCQGVTTKLFPLASKDLWIWVRGLLDKLMTHLSLGSSSVFSHLWGENFWKTGGACLGRTTTRCLGSAGSVELSTCTACIPPWLGRSTPCLGKSTTCLGRTDTSYLGISAVHLGLTAWISSWPGSSAACLGTSVTCLGRNSASLGLSACIFPWLGPVPPAWGEVLTTWGELATWEEVLPHWDWLPAFLPGWGLALPAWEEVLLAWEVALPARDWTPALPTFLPGWGLVLPAWWEVLTTWGELVAWEEVLPVCNWVPGLPLVTPGWKPLLQNSYLGRNANCLGRTRPICWGECYLPGEN